MVLIANRARDLLTGRRLRGGQGTVEYMLYVSVVVIGMCAMAYIFIGPLSDGWDKVKDDAAVVLSATETGSGDMR